MRKTFIAGNWKMNLSKQEATDLAVAIAASIVSCVALRDDGCRHATPTGATTPATHHQVPPVEEGEEHSN